MLKKKLIKFALMIFIYLFQFMPTSHTFSIYGTDMQVGKQRSHRKKDKIFSYILIIKYILLAIKYYTWFLV